MSPTAHCKDCEQTFRADNRVTLFSKVSQHESWTSHEVDMPKKGLSVDTDTEHDGGDGDE